MHTYKKNIEKMLPTNTIIHGDCLKELKKIPDETIHCVITSPPYYSLRNYGGIKSTFNEKPGCHHEYKKEETIRNNDKTAGQKQKTNKGSIDREEPTEHQTCTKCGAWHGQLGLEPTPKMYIEHLCQIFDEIRRILKKEGTLWVNIGDTYHGGNSGGSIHIGKKYKNKEIIPQRGKGRPAQKIEGIPKKSLIQIPSRFAIEMTNRGWCLRNEIIWHKNNVMPVSTKDRFTIDHEKLFFFTKNKKYFFEQQFEPHQSLSDLNRRKNLNKTCHKDHPRKDLSEKTRDKYYGKEGRNKRTVWKIPAGHFKGAHFASYPEKLIETPAAAGCPEGGIVLDPFFGSGTTGIVALKQKKRFIGIELNPEYVKLAKERLKPHISQKRLGG